MELIKDIEDSLNILRACGMDNQALYDLFFSSKPISRLLITKNYRIILADYENCEVKMEPFPKAVFLLFLRHEEGIVFKHLINYKLELLELYENITCRYGEARTIERINAICDPRNNSLNEKCARIREAFVRHLDNDEQVELYSVSGQRGLRKRIKLPRNLVTYE